MAPAQALADDQEPTPQLNSGWGYGEGKAHYYVYVSDLPGVSSMTFSIDYDESALKFSSYSVSNLLGGSLVSVADNGDVVTMAFASAGGYGRAYTSDTLLTINFDILYEGDEGINVLFKTSVAECVSTMLEDVQIEYTPESYFYLENEASSYYSFGLEEVSGTAYNEKHSVGLRLDKNAGMYAGSFTLTYDSSLMSFEGATALATAEGMIVSCNVISEGQVKVAFAFNSPYTKTSRFMLLDFVPFQPNTSPYYNISDMELTDLNLNSVAFNYGFGSSIYVSDVQGENYFKINAPSSTDVEETVDVEVELCNNTGFGALTGTLNYDPDVFDFVSCSYSDGILASSLVNINSATAGKVKIAAVSATDLTESGSIATVTLKAKPSTDVTANITFDVSEFINAQAKPVSYYVSSCYIRAYASHDPCEPYMRESYDATCEQDGYYVLVSYCNRCGSLISEETVTLPALGHDWYDAGIVSEPTCTDFGQRLYMCSRDAGHVMYEPIDPLGHDYSVSVVEPTWDEDGYTLHRCSRCGDEYVTDPVDSLSKQADAAAAAGVSDAVSALPSAGELTLDDAFDVAAARNVYSALTEDQKALVSADALAALEAAEARIAELQAAADAQAASGASDAISALPAVSVLSFEDAASVSSARAAYDALTEAQKALVPAEALATLEAAEARIAELRVAAEQAEADAQAASGASDAISALPTAGAISLDDATAVAGARAAYDALTGAQKALVPADALAALEAAESRIAELREFAAADQASPGPSDGERATVGGATYQVKSAAKATVVYSKAPGNKKSVTVPAKVTIGGKAFAVVGIAKGAFKGAKAKTVTVKSSKLTKKSVKGCFSGAKKLKTVKVKVGAKALNKKYAKKYKKAFAKKNSGRKVKVK